MVTVYVNCDERVFDLIWDELDVEILRHEVLEQCGSTLRVAFEVDENDEDRFYDEFYHYHRLFTGKNPLYVDWV